MKERDQELDATKTLLMNSDAEATPASAHERRASGMGKVQLLRNYDALISGKAIYYPVAYRLVRELGRGRQGVVFLGLRHGARGCITRHAIKLYDPDIYSSAKTYWTDMGRLADQVSRMHALHNPNLAARDIYDETNGIGYMQMELVDGVDLAHFLGTRHLEQARPLSSDAEWDRFNDVIFQVREDRLSIQPGVAFYIMRSILRGLESLHDMGFLHGDVKPANIMLNRHGYVKVVDFGRATKIHEPMSILLGSPMYMSPEIHRREPGGIPSDLYSVGLVGLELLRGRPLVESEGLSEQELLAYKMELPGLIPELLPEYVRQSEHAVYLMRRLLDPDPNKRFRNAEEAEAGEDGLKYLHQQLTIMGKDTEYRRELKNYLTRIAPSWSGSPDSEDK